MEKQKTKELSGVKRIIPLSVYANRINIPERVLKGISRDIYATIARECYWYAMRQHGATLKSIARRFNRKSHATIISGIKNIQNMIDSKDKIIVDYFYAMGIDIFGQLL